MGSTIQSVCQVLYWDINNHKQYLKIEDIYRRRVGRVLPSQCFPELKRIDPSVSQLRDRAEFVGNVK
jgi:hypothetical protein